VLGYVQSGREQGATVRCGGERLTENSLGSGYYLGPTIFTDVVHEMRIAREEIFGPVLCVFPFDTEEEVIARANATEYGLAAGVWTRSVARAHRMTDRLHAGVVWVNTYARFDPAVPFGGYGHSGYGRKFGFHQLEEYLGEKSVWMGIS
jgi:aldehyde dehydrogenase (NAD+)